MNSKLNYFERHIFVKESGIHGSGIFTSVNIPKNTIVMKISGEVISGNETIPRWALALDKAIIKSRYDVNQDAHKHETTT